MNPYNFLFESISLTSVSYSNLLTSVRIIKESEWIHLISCYVEVYVSLTLVQRIKNLI